LDDQLNPTIISVDSKTEAISSKSKFKEHWLNFERNEIFLLLSFFFYGLAFANYEPYAPVWLSQFFEVDSFLILGFVSAIPNLIIIIGTVFWGVLGDKFGSKKFVLIGLIAYTLLFFALIFSTTPIFFLVAIIIGYIFGSAQATNFFALATKSVSKPKEVILAKITITLSFSWAVFSPLVGYIYDTFENSMIIQLIIAVGTCIVSFVLILFVKEKRVEVEKEVEVPLDQMNGTAKKRTPLLLVPVLFIALMFLVFTFQSTASFWAYTSIYFLEILNVDGIYYSIFLIVKTSLAIPFSFLLGRVKSQNRVRLVIILVTAWMIINYLFISLFPSNWLLFLFMNSIPMYPIYNILFYSLVTSSSTYKRRATAYGIFNTIGTGGYVIGIIVLGVIADYSPLGIYIMLRVSLIFASIAFIFAILLYFIKTPIIKQKKEITSAISFDEL